MYFLKAMWPRFNFEITFLVCFLWFLIWGCSALFCFCTLRLNWLDLLTSFFNPGLIALEFVCLGGGATGFLYKNWSFWKWFVLRRHTWQYHCDTIATNFGCNGGGRRLRWIFEWDSAIISISQLFVYIFENWTRSSQWSSTCHWESSLHRRYNRSKRIAPGPKSMISKGLIHSKAWINLSSTFFSVKSLNHLCISGLGLKTFGIFFSKLWIHPPLEMYGETMSRNFVFQFPNVIYASLLILKTTHSKKQSDDCLHFLGFSLFSDFNKYSIRMWFKKKLLT